MPHQDRYELLRLSFRGVLISAGLALNITSLLALGLMLALRSPAPVVALFQGPNGVYGVGVVLAFIAGTSLIILGSLWPILRR